MKSKLTKLSALTLACAMGFSTLSFAADASSGKIESKFGVYSPALEVTVPASADVQINPLKATPSANKTVDEFDVASKAIIIGNRTTDEKPGDPTKKVPIPVTATINATITPGTGVITHYKSFTGSANSTKKEIYLNMSTGAVTLDNSDKLNTTKATAKSFGTTKVTPVTSYGSKLQFQVSAPTLNSGETDVEATGSGAFALTGDANYNADWAEKDLTVSISYDLKASTYQGAEVAVFDGSSDVAVNSGADASFTIAKATLEGADVTAVAMHNNTSSEKYGDLIIDSADYTVTTESNGNVTIKFAKDGVVLTTLATDDYIGEAQDVVVALSDGRFAVGTLKVNKP